MTDTLTGVGTENEVKAAFKAKLDEMAEGMQAGIKVDGNNVEVKSEDKAKMQKILGESQELKSILDMYQAVRDGNTLVSGRNIDTNAVRESAAMDAAVKSLMQDGQEVSLGTAFVRSDEFKSLRESGRNTMDRPYETEVFDLTSMGKKDVYSAMNPGSITRTFGSIQFDPMVPRGQRRTRVRDLFPVATTSSNLIDFFQVIGFVENDPRTGINATVNGGSGNARPVPDYVAGSPGNFGLKNKSNLLFRSQQAPVRTIAHWEAAHRNAIDDEPLLQATINNELLYGLALEEDYQILKGSGINEDLLGIMNAQYIQTYAAPTNELFSDTLRRSATLSIIANYPSTGYVLHPLDWEQIELQKGTGDGQYMLVTNVAVGAQAQVWRQPVVETPVMDQGTFLTGAFGTAAQIYDRQIANVRIAEQHGDFFVRNAIAILCEQRLALAIKRPEAFIKGRFAGTTAFPTDEDSNSGT